ncbi:N-acyl-phosphatidylethanolamine-hydrolyzing phospholipase D [Panus rudis PR-1116 ss-1]|nr:N-acyl-phosphatidylethanolamine-hydrolyzing phospholipase D [Panus rudis PR-1116 ss-1]
MTTALSALAYDVVVHAPSKPPFAEAAGKPRPTHHLNDHATKFTNPWPSFRNQEPSYWFKAFSSMAISPPDASGKTASQVPVQTPDWGAAQGNDKIKATWLGHACLLVELPAASGAGRGPRVIFDPACSPRCSAVQWLGPKRYTPLPCRIEDIPAVDAIVLSHNHYDHTDTNTIQILNKLYHPHVFAPLGNKPYLSSIGVPDSHIHTLDWWDARLLSLTIPLSTAPSSSGESKQGVKSTVKITCTPCQHVANRGPFDRWATLWSSWAIEEVFDADKSNEREPKKVYFAGDTGYRTVRDGEDPDAQPVCPAFAEIGEKIGPFDLAMIPIGAYSPRWMWSNLHAHPSDSVRIYKDVKARKALGMHWGTWVLTTEPILEPPRLLAEECEKIGIPKGDFDVCAIGETRVF